MKLHAVCGIVFAVMIGLLAQSLAAGVGSLEVAPRKPKDDPREPAENPRDLKENPDYTSWAKFPVGTRVKWRTKETTRWEKLLEVDPQFVRIETYREGPGKATSTDISRISSKPSYRPAAQAKTREIVVGSQRMTCEARVYTENGHRFTQTITVWSSPEVPGGVALKQIHTDFGSPAGGGTEDREEAIAEIELPKKAAEQPADAQAPKPAPPRAENPATAAPRAEDAPPAPPRAEKPPVAAPAVRAAVPPKAFSFTYQFDPPGRRDWKQIDGTTWEEREEKGAVRKFRVIGRAKEGDLTGTIVRRLPDEQLDVLIPDAGAGEWLRMRTGAEGKWNPLAKIEKSE
jgi:hypothetical protein